MKFKVLTNVTTAPKYILHKPSRPNINHFAPKMDIEFLCIDTEGTGLRWAKDHWLYGISLAWLDPKTKQPKTAWYDFPVNPYTFKPIYGSQPGLNILRHYYLNPHVDKVFANAKYDMHMLEKVINAYPVGRVHDIILAGWCSNTLEQSFKLDDLAYKYCKISKESSKKVRKETESKSREFKKINAEIMKLHIMQRCWILKFLDHEDKTVEKYGRMDALRTLFTHVYYQEAIQVLGVADTYYQELEVMHRLYKMEKRGVRANKQTIDKQAKFLAGKKHELEKSIFTVLGKEIGLGSWQQKAAIFYGWDKKTGEFPTITHKNKFPVKCPAFSDKGNPSVDAQAINTFKHIEPIPDLLRWQGYKKGLECYENYQTHLHEDECITLADMLPGFSHANVINPTFNQMASVAEKDKGTRTGRLSASDPNLTNVADPKKSSGLFVQDARAVFEPRPGYVFLFIDYSQVELRLFAERCGGKLKAAFLSGRDPHNETRESVPYLAKQPHDRGRKLAKNTNFTVINCGGANVLKAKYGMPLEEGKLIFDELHKSFPAIRKRQRAAQKFAEQHGYIETIIGRKIHVDREKQSGRYKHTYKATAFDIQGSASDLIKRAIIATSDFLEEERKESWKVRREGHLLLAIHDELIFEIKKEHFKRSFVKELVRIMVSVANDCMKIPLECEAEYSLKSWSSEAKKKLCTKCQSSNIHKVEKDWHCKLCRHIF